MTEQITLKKLEHQWDAGVITKEATVSAEGVKTFTCLLCKDTREEAIAKVPAIITENGLSSGDVANQLGVDPETAVEITQTADKYHVSLDTLKVNNKVITRRKSDSDIAGSSFDGLLAKAAPSSKTVMKVTWKKVAGADGYMIYGNKCGKSNAMKLLATVSKSKTSYQHKKLKKGTYYKYIVIAYKKVAGMKVTLRVSKVMHTVTKGGKYVNPTSISILKVGSKAKATSLSLMVKKTASIKAKESAGKKKFQRHRALSFESSDPNVAKVSAAGKITAKKKGSCKIYVYAQNGLYKAITIRVK